MKKIYLDTNTLYIYFKDSMKPISGPKEIPISIRKLKEKRSSRIKDAEYWSSCIAKYEAFKNLKHDFSINFSQFEKNVELLGAISRNKIYKKERCH